MYIDHTCMYLRLHTHTHTYTHAHLWILFSWGHLCPMEQIEVQRGMDTLRFCPAAGWEGESGAGGEPNMTP